SAAASRDRDALQLDFAHAKLHRRLDRVTGNPERLRKEGLSEVAKFRMPARKQSGSEASFHPHRGLLLALHACAYISLWSCEGEHRPYHLPQLTAGAGGQIQPQAQPEDLG